jgi:hypothetical protein
MDAYVFGTHDGDLPSHLIGAGELGNRVRAMARLDGPDHNVYYAIEAPDTAALDSHVSNLTATGTAPTSTILMCGSQPCADLLANGYQPHSLPSHLPPWECVQFLALLLEEGVSPAEELEAARLLLGADGVAAATDGEGRVLIQLGANDTETVAQASDALRASFGDTLSGGHTVTGGLLRA